MKLPRKIIQTIQSDPGAMARIARRVRRRDGRKGVSLSMVSHVLALRKRSRAIEAEIAREAGRINRERYLRAAGRIADLAQRYELAEVAQ
jgi:hypothetical protein